MDNITESFLIKNIWPSDETYEPNYYDSIRIQPGVINIHTLIGKVSENNIYQLYLLYRSLSENYPSLKDKIVDNIPDSLSLLRKANILLGLNLYEEAKNCIKEFKSINKIYTKLSGREAYFLRYNRIKNTTYVLEISDDKITEKGTNHTKNHEFVNFVFSPLSLMHKRLLLTELELLMQTEYDKMNLVDIGRAYLDRLMYEENEKDEIIDNVIVYYNSRFYEDYESLYNLEKLIKINNKVEKRITSDIFDIPFKFQYEVKKLLARRYLQLHLLESAYLLYEELLDFEKIIHCCVGMGKEKEAIEKLEERLKNTDDKMIKSDIYLLLAGLKNEPIYFDLSFKEFRNAESMRQKGLFFYKKGDFIESKIDFEKALEIIPFNDRTLFYYGCVLMELEEFDIAERVYKEILLRDERNTMAYINLSSCLIRMGRSEEAIKYLKTGVKLKNDHKLAENYFILLLKLNKLADAIALLSQFKINVELLEILGEKILLYKEKPWNVFKFIKVLREVGLDGLADKING
ncbi:TPR repeat-containing protein C19B12.01 [Astathelohania contejeani]|uniref:TPR repeat-containing protein C19B12.01 n=1 Tax=Astathelohania contejeani TaxID=164912 RepID=A0ABQ7I025_9MICR|nr:TPR repeat-containing protein C19B12.01 [Thelohania contejeani]